jgi:cephalosporin-C deacetylase-like acetyl esterase
MTAPFRREDTAFTADDGTVLRGWLYSPDAPGPHAAISMAHGYAGTRHHGIDRFAEAFAADGHVVLLHDHRGFGDSGGEPRQDVDPWTQISDWRRALSHLETRPDVDAERLGLWGTSYAGGHALVLGATDPRLRAVVAQVPTISGAEQTRRRVRPEDLAAFHAALLDDERARAAGGPGARRAIVSADPDVPASYRAPDAVAFYLQDIPDGVWVNEVTVRSTLAATTYEPGVYVERVSPTPLLMVVATHDTVTLTDTALAAYERALEPKRLVAIPGGHFDPYLAEFGAASDAARAWFTDHLAPRED